jgi:uncharacterized protein YndB with AHSA1/START domain
MANEKSAAEPAAEREISATRTFDAPRELVWKAWTDPDAISNWWGPVGFTTTTEVMDLRPGGVWIHTMHGPDGTDYPNRTEYIEVVEPERLVYRNSGKKEGEYEISFVSTITFTEIEGKTEVTLRAVCDTAEMRKVAAERYGAVEGMQQMLERFAEHLNRN